MAKRRGNDEGTIYFHEPSRRWTGQLTVGRDPISGKVKRVTVYGDTQKEVREKLDKERQRPPGTPSDMKVSQALDFWLAGHKSRVDSSTAIRYEQEVRPIREYLGKLELSQLTAMAVHNLYRWMEDQGHSRDKQRRAGVRLRQCLTRCVNIGLVPTNAADKVDLPRSVTEEVCPMSREQAGRLLRAAEGHRYEALFWLALDTGARQGELWALTWGDVDLEVPEVFFNKSLQERNGKLRIKPPKTAKGRRRVPVTPTTADRLRSLAAAEARPEDLVFQAPSGGYIYRPNFLQRVWSPLLKKAGLEGFRFHDLRHTCATLLLLGNAHPKVVSERLGHSKIEVTLNTYSHLLPTMQTSAVVILTESLVPAPAEGQTQLQ